MLKKKNKGRNLHDKSGIESNTCTEENKNSILLRIKENKKLLIGSLSIAVLLLVFIVFGVYTVISQSLAYNNKVNELENRIESYQMVLDNGLGQENTEFIPLLTMYEETISKYPVFSADLKALNQNSDYTFAIGKMNNASTGIDELETKAKDMQKEINKASDIIDQLTVLKKEIKKCAKTEDNRLNELINQLKSLEDQPHSIMEEYKEIILPNDLANCNDYVQAKLDELKIEIQENIVYYQDIRDVEKEVSLLNPLFKECTNVQYPDFKSKIGKLNEIHEQLFAVKQKLNSINNNKSFAHVGNKAEITVLSLNQEGKDIDQMSLFIAEAFEILKQSDTLEIDIDSVYVDSKLPSTDKQAKFNEFATPNNDMISDLSNIKTPEKFTVEVESYLEGLKQRGIFVSEYTEYLKDYDIYLDYKKQSDKYENEWRAQYAATTLYLHMGMKSASADAKRKAAAANAKWGEYRSKAKDAKADYEGHKNAYETARQKYKSLMGYQENNDT